MTFNGVCRLGNIPACKYEPVCPRSENSYEYDKYLLGNGPTLRNLEAALNKHREGPE